MLRIKPMKYSIGFTRYLVQGSKEWKFLWFRFRKWKTYGSYSIYELAREALDNIKECTMEKEK